MGPRHEGRGEQSWKKMIDALLEMLQWGHGTKAVENAPRHQRPQHCVPASMGPRHEGRGELVYARNLPYGLSCASMGPRHEGRGERGAAAARGRAKPGFNGATARRPWRTLVGQQVVERDCLLASMGPRHEG